MFVKFDRKFTVPGDSNPLMVLHFVMFHLSVGERFFYKSNELGIMVSVSYL